MKEKMQSIIDIYDELKEKLYDPEILSDQKELIRINRLLTTQDTIYELAIKYLRLSQSIQDAQHIIATESDDDMIQYAKDELNEAKSQIEPLEELILIELLPKDPNDDKNIFLEIRPAAWWDEAGLFALEMLRAYLAYANSLWRKNEIIDQQISESWWLKIAIIKISWHMVYSKLKFESGVHRVQRIPATESNGRVHTSTITVAIMPEIQDVEFEIDPNDVTMDTYAASSSWGQNANKNQTWVRLHHNPTWLIVTIWDSKSQMHNKDKARSVLRSRLYQIEQDKLTAQVRDARSSQIGSGDRSEKIRTYNFPQDRVTDHRIKHSRSNLPGIMMWEFQPIIDSLVIYSQQVALWKAVEVWDDD